MVVELEEIIYVMLLLAIQAEIHLGLDQVLAELVAMQAAVVEMEELVAIANLISHHRVQSKRQVE